MDIDRLRKFATNLRDEFDGHTHSIGVDVLRILDAFGAMERERWFIDISPTMGTWYAMGGEGSVITEGHKTPLASLLAAATVEGKTDVV